MYPDWAAKYIGLPYETGGRDLKLGSDCFGFIRGIYQQELGIQIPIYSDYKDENDVTGISLSVDEEDARGVWTEIEIEELKEFDILLCKFFTLHVGIYLEGGHILHCRGGIGSCIQDFFFWKRRVIGCYRHAETKDLSASVYR